MPEEQAANLQNYGAGLISRTTAMLNVGIEDPDAEYELIRREREEDIKANLVLSAPKDPYATEPPSAKPSTTTNTADTVPPTDTTQPAPAKPATPPTR